MRSALLASPRLDLRNAASTSRSCHSGVSVLLLCRYYSSGWLSVLLLWLSVLLLWHLLPLEEKKVCFFGDSVRMFSRGRVVLGSCLQEEAGKKGRPAAGSRSALGAEDGQS